MPLSFFRLISLVTAYLLLTLLACSAVSDVVERDQCNADIALRCLRSSSVQATILQLPLLVHE